MAERPHVEWVLVRPEYRDMLDAVVERCGLLSAEDYMQELLEKAIEDAYKEYVLRGGD